MRLLACLLIALFTTSVAFGQDGAGRDGPRAKEREKKFKPGEKIGLPRKGAAPVVFTPQIEAAALAFAQQHFPELAALLEHLKAHSQQDYERAIGELYRTSERLSQAKQKDTERYDLELEAWKVDSRIRLIFARMTMGDSSSLKQELRQELVKKHDLQLRRLLLERERAERRLKNLDGEIERHKAQREKIDQQADQLVKTVKNDKRAKRPRADGAKGGERGAAEVQVREEK